MKKTLSFNFLMFIIVFLIMFSSNLICVLGMMVLYYLDFFHNNIFSHYAFPALAMLASLIVGTGLSIIVGRKILKPANELINAMQVVATGDFSVRVKEQGKKTEMAELLSNFNTMAEELGGIEMFRQDFINNFSHEFKTPIVSIRGFAKQLLKDNISEEQRKEYAGIIIAESERLTNMSFNILLLTKLENQQIISDKKEFYLDEQLRKCVLLLEKQWSRKRIQLNLQLEEIRYRSNEEMLSHVWNNLILNAIKFSTEGSEMVIKCYARGRKAIVEVQDEGIGINPGTMKHIFDKFYQGEASHTTEGNGLGLPLVKRIVDLCQGRITVRSEVGKGSTFTVQLPLEEVCYPANP
ncbi:MAG TPA: HAMP domain-containing histidine kinase [Clostridiales bacterium]|nr:HAMP domain-containing histidine kinase [Clostridiales bacterium]